MPWEIPITIEDTTYPVRFNTESEPTQTDIDEAIAYLMQQRSAVPSATPASNQPGRLGSFASNVGRGALSVIPGTIGGVGYALGLDTLTGAADTIEGGINRMLPVNPEYQDETLMKVGNTLGQAGGMLATGGAAGAAGKSLALSRGLSQAAAAAKGTQLASNLLLGTGVVQGIRGGGQEAEKYKMQGGTAYARALLGGAIEGLSERALFGMGTELAPVKKFLGDAVEKGVGGIVKAAGTEAGEETVAQIGGNVATSVLAPYGVQTPGALEGAGEAALLGGVAGGALGGVNALMQPSQTVEADPLAPEAVEQPDPIEPLQQTVTKAAESSVLANADVLPATAAVIEAGGLAPQRETFDQVRARIRLSLSAEERADMEEKLAQAQDEGILADVFAEERRKAVAREDFLRRQQDLEAERQRLEDEGILGDVFAEERQRATAREQQRQQPPVTEETITPEQPIPAVEEALAPKITSEEVPNVENVIDEPGAAEVELGMEKLNSDFGTLFQLPPAQKRNLSAMREKVIAKMDEIEAVPYDAKFTDAQDKAFKALEKLLLAIDTERLSQARGNAPRQPRRYTGPSWSAERPSVAEAEAYLTEQLGPEPKTPAQMSDESFDTEGWWGDLRRAVNEEGVPRNRVLVNYAIELRKDREKQAERAKMEAVTETAPPTKPAPPAKPAAEVETPVALEVRTGENAKNADVRLALYRADKHHTLWVSHKRADGTYTPYQYISILGQDFDAAYDKAVAKANAVAAGEKLNVAFEGQNIEGARMSAKSVGVLDQALSKEALEDISGGVPMGKQLVGFGKYSNLTVDEMVDKDISYADWIANNASTGRGAKVADYIRERSPVYIEWRDAKNVQEAAKEAAGQSEKERIRAFEQRVTQKPAAKPLDTKNTTTDNKVVVTSTPKLTSRKAKDQIVDIVPAQDSPNYVPESLTKNMFPSQVSGANAVIDALEKNGAALNGDGAGVGKTRQILAVASHYAAQGKPVIIITENAAIGKPWEGAKGKANPTLGGSMAKDGQAMGVEVKLMPDAGFSGKGIYISTYNRITDAQIPEGAVIIFDESQGLVNVYDDADRNKELGQWQQKFRTILDKAEKTAFYSATPADKPHQMSYLYKVLGYKNPQDFLADARKNGLAVKTTKFGRTELKKYDIPFSSVKRTKLFRWVNDLMKKAGLSSNFIKREISYEGTDTQFHDVQGTDTSKNPWVENFKEVVDELESHQRNGWRLLAPDSYLLYAAELTKIGEAVRMVKRELAAGRKAVLYFSRIKEQEIRGRQFLGFDPMDGTQMFSDVTVLGTIPSPVDLLREELKKEGIDFTELHSKSGDTSATAQKKFAGDTNVLLASVESGGTGINLDDPTGKTPRTEIFMFAPYRGISTVQAMGRIWRASTVQDDNKPNRYVFLVASDIKQDAMRSAILAKKLQLMDASLGGTAVSRLPMSKVNYSPDQLVGMELLEEGVEVERIEADKTKELKPVDITFKTSAKGNLWAPATADLLEWYEAGGPERTGLNITVFQAKEDGKPVLGKWIALSEKQYAPEEFALPAETQEVQSPAQEFGSTNTVVTKEAKPAPPAKPAAEVETPVAGVPAEGKYSVYQAGGRWLIQQSDKRGFGDQLEDSQAEAIKESLRQQDMERQNKEFFRKQDEKAAEAQRELEAKEKPLNDYLDALGLTAMQRGKLKKTMQEGAARRSTEKNKEYTGPREKVIREMVEDGYSPKTEEVKAIKDLTGRQSNRMDNRQQEEFERKQKAAGSKTEYRLEDESGGFFVVTKAEYDYANWLKSEKPSAEFGSTNTVVTKETKDKAAESLRKKLGGQTNVGIDPSILKDAVTIGTYYIEGGARSFADFSAKMIEDFGANIQKYIRPAYEALRKRTDIDTTGMDAEEGDEPATKVEEPKTPPPAQEPKTPEPKAETPTQAAPKPATESFPTEIKLTEQPERPQASVVPPDNKPVGFSNAEMDAEAARIVGRELVRPVQEAISDDALWAQATAEFKRDSDSGRRLVTSLVATPRVVSSKEQAMLGMELVRRKNVLNAAATKFLASPEGDVGAKSEYETAQRDYDDALYANSIAGSDTARALRFRRLTANMDMELESMLSNLKAVGNKADLSKEQVAEASKIAKEYEANAKAVDALRKQAESTEAARLAEAEKVAFEAGRQEVLKDIEERAKNEAERVAEMQKRRAEYMAAKKQAAKTPNKWEEIRAAARARNAELRSNLYSDVVLVKAASMAVNDVIIGATYIAEGITKFADWVSKMRSEDINLTDDEMQQLFKESKAFDAGEDLPASETPLKVTKAKAPAIDRVKAIAADEEALDSRTVYNLVIEKMKARVEANPALEKVEMSTDDLTSIISEVTKDIQEFFPDITEREIRDLFSGYGTILEPSKDELAKQMRQLTALGRLNSAIEDAIAGLAPLKSGVQRDRATQAIRLQQKKLARELRMMGHEYEAGEEQLRSPLDAVKARLSNQIDDMAMEINTRKKVPRRPSVDYDKDTQDLADLRDELKRISDFINAPAGPTFTELVNEEMKKIDARIAELQKTLAEGNFAKEEDELLHTAELDAKRAVRDALNNTLQKKRREAADKLRTQEDIDKEALEAVEEAITELNRKIEAEDYTLPQRRTPTQTAQYKARVNEKKRLQQKVRDARANLFGRKGMTDEQRIKQATAAVDKSIERMQKMLTSGNYDVPKRTSKTPETPELAQKRDARDKMRKRILELRKLKRDALIDPIAKQLKTDKKRIQTRMDKLKKRMETGDFSKPVKREKPTDPELLELLAKEEKLKERWGEMLLNHKLSQRSRAKRYWDNVFDLFSMGRFLKTSTDLSAIANQGNFALFSHPVLSMRQLGGMWKAMQSDTNQKIINAKIRELPEYKSGEMKRAGLYLALDAGPNDPLQRQEEAMASRWVDKIPKRYGGGILRATSRAYTTYLDLIRVATYLSLKNNLVEGGWFMQPQETTPERLQSVANLINNGTGRGSLGSGRFGAGMSQAAPFLNTFLFALRFGVSRFVMTLGIPLWTASKGTKVLIAKEYTKYLAGLTTAMILYSMFQDEDDKEMEFDPTSSDFGKVLFDNQRVDVMGGFQQPLVFLLRLLFGEYKNSKGLIKPLREGDRPLNLFRETPLTDKPKFTDRSGAVVVGDFLRYKLSPTASLLLNTIQGKTPVGERTDLMSEVITMPVPLIIDQMYETAKAQQDDPFMAALLMGSGVVGVRTSNQDPKEDRSKAKTTWEQLIEYTKYYSGVK